MDKILVPTDFSNNSKPGIRFAIRMAARSRASLVFLHVIGMDGDTERAQLKLNGFVYKMYQSMRIEPQDISCEVRKGFKADLAILEYCQLNPDIVYLCMSTRGAGFFNKILGTNTGNLIEKASIPVFAIPRDYRVKPLTNLVYASDLENIEEELQIVVDFARPKGLSVEILHFVVPSSVSTVKQLKEDLELKMNYPLKMRVVKVDHPKSFFNNLLEQIDKLKPSVLCLFTDNERSFFEKIFSRSLAQNVSYQNNVPLLTYKKLKKK